MTKKSVKDFPRSIKDLERSKRATPKQIQSALKAKAIDKKGKSVGRTYGRLEYGFGKIAKADAPGIIKGFRRKFKADFGAIIKDIDGNVIARTHIAKGSSTLPEQMIVKALAKYGKKYDEIELVLTIADKKKGAVKKSRKKPSKKPAKKSLTNSRKISSKNTTKKKAAGSTKKKIGATKKLTKKLVAKKDRKK